MKKEIGLVLLMLLVIALSKFNVSGQVPTAKSPELAGLYESTQMRLQTLEKKSLDVEQRFAALEKRIKALENPTPKMIPITK